MCQCQHQEERGTSLHYQADYEQWARHVVHIARIPPHLAGCRYLILAIVIVASDPSRIHLVTKDLYYEIAKHFSTSWKSVERNMRWAIDASWDNGGKEALSLMANRHLAERPSPSLFIAIAAEYTINLYCEMK